MSKLRERNLLDSTLVIITANHGDSPIDPAKLKHANPELIPKTVTSVHEGLLAGLEQDGSVALLWLSDQDRTADVVNALRKIQEEARIHEIYSGESLKLLFNDPKSDPRVPDIIIQPTPGQIYVDSGSTFIAEHSGNANTDRGVPLLIYHPRFRRQEIKFPVQTSQIAPSILRALGLNPFSLYAVKIEKTPLLPSLVSANCNDRCHRPGKSRTFSFGREANLGLPGQISRPRKNFGDPTPSSRPRPGASQTCRCPAVFVRDS